MMLRSWEGEISDRPTLPKPSMSLEPSIDPRTSDPRTSDPRTSELPTSELPTSEQCATELMEAVHPIMQFIRTEMRSQREPSLSVPQFRLLAFLSRHPGSSLSEVAEHLGVTRATASAMTDRLVQRHLVDRAEDPQARRQIMLKLTKLGSDRLEQMRDTTRGRIAELLKDLTMEELANISTGLTTLGRVFRAAK